MVPLTAAHSDLGLLDATAEDLRAGGDIWTMIHKTRPRAVLTCRGCGHGLHAKVSSGGLRFFAHDSAQSDCPTAGESIAHRLLKLELASAARAAGWDAELEVGGEGWRADVLASSPTGRRVAWEAQLAAITPEDIAARDDTMRASGLEVCWVADRHRSWVGQVPAIVVSRPTGTEQDGLRVTAGAAKFVPAWCGDRRACEAPGEFGPYAKDPGPCDGHGHWEPPTELTLAAFVAAVCADTLRCHPLTAWHRDAYTRQGAPTKAWTAGRYITLEREQILASQARDHWEDRFERERAEHARRIDALLQREHELRRPAARRVAELTGTQAWVNEEGRSEEWAMGVPVAAGAQGVAAIICPVASRIEGPVQAALAPLLLFAASSAEAARLRQATGPSQRIEILTGDMEEPTPTMMGAAWRPRQAARRTSRQ